MKPTWLIAPAAASLLLAAPRLQAAPPALLDAGATAPDFTVQDRDGKPVKLSDYKGKVVVLDFWATWCPPCRKSLPHTNEIAQKYKDKGVVVLAVNTSDSKAAFDKWLPQHPEYSALTFVIDTAKPRENVASTLYGVTGIPTQFIIDKDEKIVKNIVGYGEATPELENAIVAAGAPPADPAAPATAPNAATASGVDPQASALMDQVVAAYKGLQSYSDTTTTQITRAGQPPAARGGQTRLAFRRPSQVSVVTTGAGGAVTTETVSSGTTLFSASLPDKKYTKTPVTADAVAQTIGAIGGGGFLAALITGQNPFAALIAQKQIQSLTLGPPDTLDGVPVDTLTAVFSLPNGTGNVSLTVALAVGKDDRLLRRMTETVVPSGTDAAKATTVTELHTGVKANPDLPATLFAFTPPPGAKLVTSLEPPMYDPRLVARAQPFPIQATDLAGKPVSLAQYRGKVVLMDFWATWCGPCVGELPNVIAAYRKFHPQGFEIVGISLDRPGDRDKLVAFTKAHAMPWRQVYDGGYWQSKIPRQYGVNAIPFTLLIGRDGKIAAVGARGPALEPAIRAALARKTAAR